MSGEYYCDEGPDVTKLYQDIEPISPRSNKNANCRNVGDEDIENLSSRSNKEANCQDVRLHDIEEQLEMAENRCNSLKDQLDYMKHMYVVNKNNPPKIRKISNILEAKKRPDELSGSSASDETGGKSAKGARVIKRQNSNAIRTDTTGAAVKTINNILNGITDSVNRLSELHVQVVESPRCRKIRSIANSPHHIIEVNVEKSKEEVNNVTLSQKTLTDESGFIGDNNIEKPTRIGLKSRQMKRRCKDAKPLHKKPVTSYQSLKRPIKLEKKVKSKTKTSVTDKSSKTSVARRRFLNSVKPPNAQTHKLVEIYHNIAAKNSDSDEVTSAKKQKSDRQKSHSNYPENHAAKRQFCEEGSFVDISQVTTAPDQIEAEAGNLPNIPLCQNEDLNYEYGALTPNAPRTEISCHSKNYELPTIASKMKQVAKSYLNTLDFKAIPFCAAISTTPSHNIGINIQQVMSIMKTRQPINGISPTLAHNIGLAAERLNSRPLSALMTCIQSKTAYRSLNCPLSRTTFNLQQLQEQAKGIPEETIEEEMDETDESPDVKTIIITGPSGDMEVKNRNDPVWMVPNDAQSEQCTCVPPSGSEYQQVASKYLRPLVPCVGNTTASSQASRLSKYQNTSFTQRKRIEAKRPIRNGFGRPTPQMQQPVLHIESDNTQDTPLVGKEKNLKMVLTNLHNEFETLNKQYEDLAQRANTEDVATLKELESMEAELNKKEEEITMVMTLYKEVLALKQQVKLLRLRTSQASVAVAEQKDSPTKFREYNDPKAAFHLTKLLRQIQLYQMRYKRKVNTL